MNRIFFAFPEERQKVLSLFEGENKNTEKVVS